MFRNTFRKFLSFNAWWGLAFILAFGIPRFIVVMQSNVTGDFSFVSFIFIAMWFTPFVLLKRKGRLLIGIKVPGNYKWLLLSFLLGVMACTAVYALGTILFGESINNWTVYIARSYHLQTGEIAPDEKIVYFWIFALVSMIFSPIGEEFLYRGFIHECFRNDWGPSRAAIADSAAFGLTHLAHFGIIYWEGSWRWLIWPSVLWVGIIFLTGLLFNFCRARSDSIFAAILCHAGFNLALTYFIFYWM